MELREALAGNEHFGRLTSADLDILQSAFDEETHPAGHELLEEGARGGDAWLLLEGEVTVTRTRPGYIDELTRLGPGHMFGLGALVQGGRRGASVRAIGPVRAARLPQSAYEMLMRDPSPIGRELLRAIAQQLASDLRTVVRQFRAVLEPPRA